MSDHRDFEALVLPHRAALFGHALTLTRNPDEAEDLVQETTLRALRGFGTFRADGPVRAWLLAILRNLFINGYRARARAPRAISLDAIENPDPVAPADAGPERALLSKLENEALGRAVDALPPVYRDVLVLSDMGGLTYQEISDRLGRHVKAVDNALQRIKRKLEAHLAGTTAAQRVSAA